MEIFCMHVSDYCVYSLSIYKMHILELSCPTLIRFFYKLLSRSPTNMLIKVKELSESYGCSQPDINGVSPSLTMSNFGR